MRVTNNMLVNNLVSNVNKNLVNMSKKQDQLATGKKVHTASDDPVAASKIIKYRTDISEYAQYQRNTSDALSWLETTESTMMDINKVLQRAREIVVKASNGTNTLEDNQKVADELEQLKKQIIMDGNFSFAGRYVFSGYHTEERFLNEDGTFKIGMTDVDIKNPPTTKYQIGVGEEIVISTNGLDLFGYVLEEGPFVEKMPNGISSNGVESSKAEFKGDININTDYTSSGQISIAIDGQNYDLDMADLDLSWVNTSSVSDTNAAKSIIVSSLKNAIANPATVPQTSLGDETDIYFNESDQLVIRSNTFGAKSISQVSGENLGLSLGEYEYDFPLNSNYASGGNITIDINGKVYDVDVTNLDLTASPDDETSKNYVIDALMNATSNPATIPSTYLKDDFNVEFNQLNKLTISSLAGDEINVTQSAGTTLGLTVGKSGNLTKEASLVTGVITDAEVGTNFNGREFVINVNGRNERITIEDIAAPETVVNLVTAFQNSIDSKFGVGSINITESGGVIKFELNNITPDGETPKLEIYPVKSNKSKLVEDFDDLIKAINADDKTTVNEYIDIMDSHMSKVLTNLSDIGARTNRIDLVLNRINENNVTFTKLLSDSQDADMSEVIMYLKNSENVYRASLSAGARVIQPSLIDFLR